MRHRQRLSYVRLVMLLVILVVVRLFLVVLLVVHLSRGYLMVLINVFVWILSTWIVILFVNLAILPVQLAHQLQHASPAQLPPKQ